MEDEFVLDQQLETRSEPRVLAAVPWSCPVAASCHSLPERMPLFTGSTAGGGAHAVAMGKLLLPPSTIARIPPTLSQFQDLRK